MTMWNLSKTYDPYIKIYFVSLHLRDDHHARLFDEGTDNEHDADLMFNTLQKLLQQEQIKEKLKEIPVGEE